VDSLVATTTRLLQLLLAESSGVMPLCCGAFDATLLRQQLTKTLQQTQCYFPSAKTTDWYHSTTMRWMLINDPTTAYDNKEDYY